MDKIIVYLDDAEYARRQLTAITRGPSGTRPVTHWIMVACPPRMTRRLSKWAVKLFDEIRQELRARGDTLTEILADGPLMELTRELQARHGGARLWDARRPKWSQDDLQAVTPEPPAWRGPVPGNGAGMGAVLARASR